MKSLKGIVLVVALTLNACPQVQARQDRADHLKRRFLNSRLIKKGMNRQDVESVINKEIIVGYEASEAGSDQFRPITVKSLQREEEKVSGSQKYLVLYFLEGIKDADDKISDDELFPVVFENDTLAGMGWDFMEKLFGNDVRP